MRIVHCGWFELGSVHGTHHALWQLALAQRAAGHEVAIANLGWEVAPAAVAEARAHGIELVGIPCGHWDRFWTDPGATIARAIDRLQPDIAHLQYVRIPKFRALARVLAGAGIPWVVSLHGGLMAAEMRRNRLRKLAYWRFVEAAIHRGAAGIHFVTEAERLDYHRHLGRPKAADAVVANVVEIPPGAAAWQGPIDSRAPRLASLGRYDVWHKGLDLGVDLLRGLRSRGFDASLHLHGDTAGRFDAPMDALRRAAADLPVVDHGRVSGAAKFAALARHDIYLQYSRFELFGMSLVEALAIGMPVILSEACDLAGPLGAAGAALVVPMDPALAAEVVAGWLADPVAGASMAARGREWARRHCAAATVAAQMTDFYRCARADRPTAAAGPAPRRPAAARAA